MSNPKQEKKEKKPIGPAAAEVKEQAKPDYTRAWQVRHPTFGGCRIMADSEDEAAAEFIRLRCPSLDLAQVKPSLQLTELAFSPADTERDKPHGWLRGHKRLRRMHA